MKCEENILLLSLPDSEIHHNLWLENTLVSEQTDTE